MKMVMLVQKIQRNYQVAPNQWKLSNDYVGIDNFVNMVSLESSSVKRKVKTNFSEFLN